LRSVLTFDVSRMGYSHRDDDVSMPVHITFSHSLDPLSVGMQKSPLVGIEFSPPIIDREIADGRESSGGGGSDRRTG
jgi:hypothetical protein